MSQVLSPPTTEDEYRVDFPVLWVALEWVERHCVIPDGFHKGNPYILADWQAWVFANHYRIRSDAPAPTNERPLIGAPAFFYRRSQIVMPQKAGKGPMTAAQVCLEGMGPAMFAGFARGGEKYDCRDHRCGCGWVYEYAPGEPMGAPWPTPLIQITAYSEEQTFNIYGAFKPMVENGPLAEVVVRIGEEFTRLDNDGRIDTVTSSNQSRLGQRVTFVPQDETGIWLVQNKMDKVATTQRRGLSGMSGRSTETTNGWDPSENSVAQKTARNALRRPDIFRFHRLAPANLSFGNQRDRRKILKHVYRGCWWVDLNAIEAEAMEIMLEDPAQAERFYGNRIVAGQGAWLPDGVIDATRSPKIVPRGTPVAAGFDGSETSDWTAIRLVTQDNYLFTPTYGPDARPTYWDPSEWGGEIPRAEVDAAVDEIFRKYTVRMMFCDPKDWHSEIGAWSVKYGEEVVISWPTYRIIPMHNALVRSLADFKTGRIKHDGDPIAEDHLANCRKAAKPSDRYILSKPDAHRHIDVAMAGILAHEAAATLTEEKKWGSPSRYTRAVGAVHLG
jgi:hypothetical protein